MKSIFILLVALVIAACSPASPDEFAANQKMVESKLPDGCRVGYAGRFGYEPHGGAASGMATLPVVYVICDNATTTTANSVLPQKGNPPIATVTINQTKTTLEDLNKRKIELRKLYEQQEKQLIEIKKLMESIQ